MNGLESPPNAFDSKNSWSRAFTLLELFELGVSTGSEGVDPSPVVVGTKLGGMKVTESFPTRVVGARFFPATRSREIARVSSLKSTGSTLGGGWQYNSFALT
jgi:hypothetical protein